MPDLRALTVTDADDGGRGGVTEQDFEAKEPERRLDKTRQCLRWAPQVDLHAAARGDGSGEGREREAKFRIVEVGGEDPPASSVRTGHDFHRHIHNTRAIYLSTKSAVYEHPTSIRSLEYATPLHQ